MCAPPPRAHAGCSQGALQIALPARERVVARGELEKARSQERGATAHCASLVAEDSLRAPRTRGARAQPAKTAAAATVGRSPRTWRVAAQRAACLSGETACVHGEQLRSVKRTPKRYVGARNKRTVPEATSLTELVRGVLYGPRLLSCQLLTAESCRVMIARRRASRGLESSCLGRAARGSCPRCCLPAAKGPMPSAWLRTCRPDGRTVP